MFAVPDRKSKKQVLKDTECRDKLEHILLKIMLNRPRYRKKVPGSQLGRLQTRAAVCLDFF